MAHNRQAPGTLSARWLSVAAACHPALILGPAAFLLALLCCQTAPPEYQAEAVILRDAGELDATSGEIEAWLKSDAVLKAALTNTDSPEWTVADLRDRIAIATLNQPDESPRLAITCTAPRCSAAINLARELATQVADHFDAQRRELVSRQADESLEQVRERLRVTRDAEERQRGELERLRHGQLAMVVAGPRGQSRHDASGESDNLNPRWVELKKQLDTLHSQRTEMLEVLQENHPEINGLNLRIAKVSGSLGKTPRQLVAPIEPISHRVSSASHRKPLLEWRREGSAIIPSPIAQQQHQQEVPAAPITREGLDPYLNMAAQIDEAAHQLAVLTSQRKGIEWDQATIQQSQADFAGTPHSAWRPEPARRVAKIGGGYSSRQLWWAGAFSFGATGLVMLSQRRILARKRLTSLTDVLINVRLPLVGTVELAADDSASTTRGTTPLRLLTRCGQAFLLGILLTCLASAWLDLSLAAEFQLDPLGAFAETAQRIL
ncbi:MAG: hypothetical protein ACR2FY_18040 [Pirellulaceae bacterium]